MSKVTFKEEASAPATPGAGYVTFYAKTDGKLYFKDDTGTEYPVKPTGGGTGDLLSDGSVALTADWDVGAFKITANQLESDVADGTAPLIVASTTQVDNLTSEWASKAVAVVEPCRNESGAPLTKGTPVYISGYSVGQDLILVTGADADSASTMPCIGLVLADIANNADGYVVTEGDINGVDTSTYTAGDELYVSGTAGTLTTTRPTGTALVQEVAIVLRSHATLGVLQVVPGALVEGLPNLAQDNVWVGNASGTPTATDAAGLRTLLNVEDGATADQSDAEIETAYNNQVAAASQAEMEAGTETAIRRMTPERVAQAIAALAPSGATEFSDAAFRVQDNADATKEFAFEVSAITTATTRTATVPDRDFNLSFSDLEPYTFEVATVADQDYVLWDYAPFAGTISAVGAISESGTCTLTGKIGVTALGGTANSVSSSYTEQAHASANTFSKGDLVQFTVSSNSACLGLAGTFYITRTG